MIFSISRTSLSLAVVGALAGVGGVDAAGSSNAKDAGNTLYTSSVTYCAPPTGILVQDFGFQYYAKNNTASFTLTAASVSSNLNLAAQVSIDAYGISALNWTINLCDVLGGVLCPLPEISFSGGSALPIPEGLTSSLPSIAYSVPDLEAYAQVRFTDVNTNELVACIEATLSNGWTTRIPAVLWSTAGVALLAVLVSWFHTAWNISRSDPKLKDRAELVTGSSSPGQWRVVDVIFMFQSIAASGLLSLEFPSTYRAFVLSFQWALGIYSTPKVQQAIDRARALTGGKLSSLAYPETAFVNRKSIYTTPIGGQPTVNVPTFSGYVIPLVKRFEDFLLPATYQTPSPLPQPSPYNPTHYNPTHYNSLGSRASVPSASSSNSTTAVPSGIPLYVNSLNVPVANAWFTVFFTWLFVWLVFIGLHAILWAVVVGATHGGRKVTWKGDKQVVEGEGWAWRLRKNFGLLVVTNVLRTSLMLFFPVAIFSMYQFTLSDAWLPIFLGAIVLFINLATLLLAEGALLLASRRSHASVPTTRRSSARVSRTNTPSGNERLSRRTSSNSVSPVDSDLTTDSLSSQTVVEHHKSMFSPFPTFRPLCSALYQQYRRPLHAFWLLPILFSTFAKACFIAFAQGHGAVQIIGIVIVEGITLVLLAAFRPHTNKKGDWLSATLSLFRLVAMGLMIAFLDQFFTITGITRTVLGLVIIAVWGLAVVLLVLGIFYNLFWGIIWKRHTPSAPLDTEDLDSDSMRGGPHPVVMTENEKVDDNSRSRLSSTSTFQGDSTTNGNELSKDKPYPSGFTSIAEHDEREQAGRYSQQQLQPPFLSEDNRHSTSYVLDEQDLAPSIPPFIGTPVPLTSSSNGEPRRSSMVPPSSSRVALPPPVMDHSRRQSYPASIITINNNAGYGSNGFVPPMVPFGSAGGTGVATYTPSGNTPFYDARESPYEQGGQGESGSAGEQQRGGYFGRGQ